MSQLFIEHIQLFILPPGGNFVVIALGLLCLNKWRPLGKWLIGLSLVILYLLSTSLVADNLMRPLEQIKPLSLKAISPDYAQAIVVLGGAQNYAPEYGDFTVSNSTLARARYVAFLYHKTHLPVLTTGFQQAALLARTLKNTFNVPVKWQEPNSLNTFENAEFSKKLLQAHHVKSFYLVTSVWHMPRALWAFKREGLHPIPAPTDYRAAWTKYNDLTPWLPSANALAQSSLALHEYLGLVWYAIRY